MFSTEPLKKTTSLIIDSLDLSKNDTYAFNPPREDNSEIFSSLPLSSISLIFTPELRYASSLRRDSSLAKSNFVKLKVFLEGRKVISVPLS